MSLSNYSRGVAELLVIAFIAAWLIADKVFGVHVSDWPRAAKIAAFVTVVGLLTFVTMRATRGGRTRD